METIEIRSLLLVQLKQNFTIK